MFKQNNKTMKITTGYIPDRCKETNVVSISSFSVTYSQQADTNSSSDECQFITVEAQNNGEGDDGWYYNIKTDTHWSVDSPEQIADIVRDFTERMIHNTVLSDDLETY